MPKGNGANANGNGRAIKSQAALDRAIKGICDILRRDKAKGARLYVPELTWMLFLQALDVNESEEEARLGALGLAEEQFQSALEPPYRWRDWAVRPDADGTVGTKRKELSEASLGSFLTFVNDELFPYLRSVGASPHASHRQRVISEIFRSKERTVIASETNLLDALDRVQALAESEVDDTHFFTVSQAFEGLLPALGEKKNDGGQFFTPREVIRAIVRAVDPKLGGTVYDPCCGTGGFLIEAHKHLLDQDPTPTQIERVNQQTLWGREDADEAIPICLANMVLHDVEFPRIWHGNTLTGIPTYAELFEDAPTQFDYVLTNPPFGSKEGKDAQAQFAYKSGKAQILFLQHVIDSIKDGGTCGMVIDEGVLFHTKTVAFQQTKRKLLEEADLWCVVSLPSGVFVNAGAGAKTDLLFFTKGQSTKRAWYYDMTYYHVTRGRPLRLEDFDDFFTRLALDPDDPERISTQSWWRTIDDIRAAQYDLKATNPNAPDGRDLRSVEELTEIIRESQAAIEAGLGRLGSGS
jgi:type I restriction enzyme M protein